MCTQFFSESAFVNLKIYEQDWIKKVVSDPLNNVNVRPTILNTSGKVKFQLNSYRSFDINPFISLSSKSYQLLFRTDRDHSLLAGEEF
jgi:hypothetical protein